MNKYLRNPNFKWLSLSLLIEFCWSFILLIMLLAFAKNYSENKIALIIVGSALLINHGVSAYFAVWGLMTVKRHTAATLPHAYQKSVYWNAAICGILFYPVFVAWYAYRNSGYTLTQINEFTKQYIYKNFEIVIKRDDISDKLDAKFKQEHINVEELIKEKRLTSFEGHKYLFDNLYDQSIINDVLLEEIQKEYLEKIIEAAN